MTLVAEPATAVRPRLVIVTLVIALLAGGVMMARTTTHPLTPQPGRRAIGVAWAHAQRANMPANLPDGPVFQPLLFLNSTTVLGTASSADAHWIRLVLHEADGSVRTLRRLPYGDGPSFENATVTGDVIAWTESTGDGPIQIWSADTRTAAPARRLTADTGNFTSSGNQYGLIIAGGRVYWTAVHGDEDTTELRSTALDGGPIQIRPVSGSWALSAWPWLSNDTGDHVGGTALRNLATGQDVEVRSTGSELTACSPTWCRMMVQNAGGLVEIDEMHADGSDRRRIAGSGARAALTDVAVLDRFEVLSEPGPYSDLTGTAKLLVFDLKTGGTVDVAADAGTVGYGAGVLWWSTGSNETTTWHSVDLRTV